MEEMNFVLLWKEQYEKIDQSLQINKRLLKENIEQKAGSAIRSLIRLKAFGITAAVVYLLLLGGLLFVAITRYTPAANYFIISIGIIFLVNIKALADYIRHLALAANIDYNGSITDIQRQLIRLQLSIIRHVRTTLLQLPFWSSFYLSSSWFPGEVGWGYVVFQVLFTAAFCYATYFLYKNLRLDNLHKKWVKTLVAGAGGKSIARALLFYEELAAFSKEEIHAGTSLDQQ